MCKRFFINRKLFVFGLFIILYAGSTCTRDNEEDLFLDDVCITQRVTYNAVIAPIMQDHCNACHNSVSPSANVITGNYASLTIIALESRLLGAVRHETGFVPMPFGLPKLDDCLILRLETWIDEGMPEN